MNKDKVWELTRLSHLDVYGMGKDREKFLATLQYFVAMIEREVRGDAEPVAWCWVRNGRPEEKPFYGKGPDQDIIKRAATAEIPRTVQYFYTHPAPAVVRQLADALEQLMSIVKIHSAATSNNFAWAEMDFAKEALAAAKEESE